MLRDGKGSRVALVHEDERGSIVWNSVTGPHRHSAGKEGECERQLPWREEAWGEATGRDEASVGGYHESGAWRKIKALAMVDMIRVR
jgi:hypothetical protein